MSAKNNDPCLNGNTQTASEPSQQSDSNVALIRQLNDRLRKTGSGGQVLITDGILAKGLEFAQKAVEAVTQFDSFNDDNDPWLEHDCASLSVDGLQIMWKIDYYDRQMTHHSPDPANGKVTCRVLTIMLASDY